MSVRTRRLAQVFLCTTLAAAGDLAAQKPVVTLSVSGTRLAEHSIVNRSVPNASLAGTLESAAAPSITLTVTRTGSPDLSALTVNYTVGGTATPGADYPALTGSITIPLSQSSATLILSAIDDVSDEPDETIELDLTATLASDYVLATPASTTIWIVDDDQAHLSELDIVSDSILAGNAVDVRATLSIGAPAEGVTVGLISSDGVVIAPSIVIPGGAQTGVASLQTGVVTDPTAVIVEGSAGGATRSDTLFLFPPPEIAQFELDRDAVLGGRVVNGTIRLAQPASPTSQEVTIATKVLPLASPRVVRSATIGTSPTITSLSGTSPVTSPQFITIPAGATTATITLETAEPGSTVRVEVRGVVGTSSAADTILIHPIPTMKEVTISPDPAEGGSDVTATFLLASPIPAGMNWTAHLDYSGAITSLRNPSNVSFGSGASEKVQTIRTTAVPTTDRGCLRVETGTSLVSGCATLKPPAVTAFTLNRDAIFGGTDLHGSLSLSRPVPNRAHWVSLDVQLLGSAGAVSPLTTSRVHVAAGATQTNFTIPVTDVAGPLTVAIQAPSGLADTVVVHPSPALDSLSLQPDPVEGGADITATFLLASPIPPGMNWTAHLDYVGAIPSLRNPSNVSFGSGTSQRTQTIKTTAVPTTGNGCVRVTNQTSVVSGCATLKPPAVTAISLNRDAIFGGTELHGSLTLSRSVSSSPHWVSLDVQVVGPAGSNSPLTTNRVRVDAGATQVSFAIPSVNVSTAVTLAITTPSGITETVVVHPAPVVASVTIEPNPAEGGSDVTATVRLVAPIPAAMTWTARLDYSGEIPRLRNPPNVTFGAGTSERTRTLKTNVVTTTRQGCVRVNAPTGVVSGCVALNPPTVTAFSEAAPVWMTERLHTAAKEAMRDSD